MNKAVQNDYWDEWQREALAAGVKAPLAKLGMEVLRAHRKNRWPKHFLGRGSRQLSWPVGVNYLGR
jgi:hypothetical protein